MPKPSRHQDLSSQNRQAQKDKSQSNPALVINIHTWATPLVGAIMLFIGLATGYLGRPLLTVDGQPTSSEPQSQATGTISGATPQTPSQTAIPTTPPDPDSAEALMELVVSRTRHFKGAADAPVTIIEFSDFK